MNQQGPKLKYLSFAIAYLLRKTGFSKHAPWNLSKILLRVVDTQLKALEVVEPPRELCQKPEGRSVRHVTLRLPKGANYRAGDHLETWINLPKSWEVGVTIGVYEVFPLVWN